MKTLSQRLEEIKLLMEYAVPDEFYQDALILVEQYQNDIIALNIFNHFYSFLPEAREDAVTSLRLIAKKEGAFLICAETMIDSYLYFASSEAAEFAGLLSEAIRDTEVLDFFGIDAEKILADNAPQPSSFKKHTPVALDRKICPACQASPGEFHTFGCPVEVCPWCDGQLTACKCRFSALGTENIVNEKQLEELLLRINKKGRIAYDPATQNPFYPSDSGTGAN